MTQSYSCPTCRGEGKVTRQAALPLFGFAALTFASSALLFCTMTSSPRDPTELEQCATACGARFKSWTSPTPAGWRRAPVGTEHWHPAGPGKCECADERVDQAKAPLPQESLFCNAGDSMIQCNQTVLSPGDCGYYRGENLNCHVVKTGDRPL